MPKMYITILDIILLSVIFPRRLLFIYGNNIDFCYLSLYVTPLLNTLIYYSLLVVLYIFLCSFSFLQIMPHFFLSFSSEICSSIIVNLIEFRKQ